MNEKIVKKTQDTLGKIIKKPPLTEKLLNKPPFRFLHDVVTSVIKTAGFMKGLYTDAEMNSENIKDKESKIAFLQKAIDMTSLVIEKSVAARPSKIVAGHEPEKTNEFLQALAEAVNRKVDNDEYVKKVLSGDSGSKPPSGSKKERESSGHRKDRDTSADRRKKKDEGDKKREGSSGKDKEKDKDKRERSKDKDRERSKDRDKSKDRERSRDRDRDKDKDKDKERDRDKDKDRERRKKREKEREKDKDRAKDGESSKDSEPAANGEQEEDQQAAKIPRPSSAKGSRRRHTDGGEDSSDEDEEDEKQRQQQKEKEKKKEEPTMNGTLGEEDLPPQVAAARRMARPSSARPAAPRIKKAEAQPEEPHVVGSGNVPNVIVDKGGDSDDDDMFVAKEEEPQTMAEPEEPPTQAEADEDGGEHGGLVKRILETKKELEGGSQQAQPQGPAKKTEIERPQANDAARKKQREMVQKEIDKLRGSIQTLTRSVNPLGKILDYVQEDLDSMQKELEMWKKENKQNALSLQQEQSITEMSIEPLKAQLSELDQAIADQLDLIAAVKNNIIRNDDRVKKILGSITKS